MRAKKKRSANPAALALNALRKRKVSAERRSEIARQAARARWGKKRRKPAE